MTVINQELAREKCNRLRTTGQKIVFTNGCFDLIHGGHIQLFEEANRQGNYLIVGLNSDKSIRRLKGPVRPILPEKERARILDAIEYVDDVVIFSEDTPAELIEIVTPDVLVKGADYEVEDIVGADYVQARGGEVYRVELVEGKSTSKIIDQICAERTDTED